MERQLSATRPQSFPQHRALRTAHASGVAFVAPIFEPFDAPSFPAQDNPPFLPAPSFDCPAISGLEADNLITSAAKREDISASLLRAVIKRESAFRPCAISEKGALGLMQLMPATAEQFGVQDPFNPRQNVLGGAAFLKQLLNRFGGDVRLALGAYNAGPERVDAFRGIPDIAETQNYVSSITSDLGLPNVDAQSASEETSGADSDSAAAPTKPISNAMTKPDLRHLTLGSPNLQFRTPATSVQLISGK